MLRLKINIQMWNSFMSFIRTQCFITTFQVNEVLVSLLSTDKGQRSPQERSPPVRNVSWAVGIKPSLIPCSYTYSCTVGDWLNTFPHCNWHNHHCYSLAVWQCCDHALDVFLTLILESSKTSFIQQLTVLTGFKPKNCFLSSILHQPWTLHHTVNPVHRYLKISSILTSTPIKVLLITHKLAVGAGLRALLVTWPLWFQMVFVCVVMSGRVSPAELTCETLILLSTNFTGNFLSQYMLLQTRVPLPDVFFLFMSLSKDPGPAQPDIHHQ